MTAHQSIQSSNLRVDLSTAQVVEMASCDLYRGAQIFAPGPVSHPRGDYVVDATFITTMLASFQAFTKDGYFPPILKEHNPDGGLWGLIVALYERDGGLYIDIEFRRGVMQAIRDGELRYLSPAFYPRYPHPHTGEVHELVLCEVSFVSMPHLKNIQPLQADHYQMSECGFVSCSSFTPPAEENPMSQNAQGSQENTPSAGSNNTQTLDRITEQLTVACSERDAYKRERDDLKGQLEEMAKSLKAERQNRLTTEIKVKLGEAVDAATISELITLHEANPSLYNKTLERLATPATPSTPATPPTNNSETDEVGSQGAAPAGKATYEQAVAMGEKAGIENGSEAMITYLNTNHPHLMA